MANEVNHGIDGDVYDSTSIKVLEGLEAVRLRPAMYIGSTGEMGLHHLVYEVVDNSVDEALAGYATEVTVTIHDDNSVTVIDNGRGIPVDIHEEEGVSAAQVVMTKLHAGGKFDSKSYKVSGGLHGVGVSCVNALSERLELEIWRDGYTWQQEYACGIPKAPLAKAGKAGTQDRHARHVQARHHHHGGHGVQLRHAGAAAAPAGVSEQGPQDHADRRARGSGEDAPSSCISGGIAEFIKHLNRGKTVLHEKPIHFEAEREMPNSGTLTMEVALQYNDGYSENIFSFANNINTVDGGTHLSGFRSRADPHDQRLRPAAQGLFKDVKENLTGDDVREGLTAVVSVKVPQPQFEGQTKGKLNSDIAGHMTQFVNEKLSEYFDKNSTVGPQDRRQGDRSLPRARSGAQGARPDAPQRRAGIRRDAAASWPIARRRIRSAASCSWWRANRPAARPSRAATGASRRSCR